jgi:hypothetical protein
MSSSRNKETNTSNTDIGPLDRSITGISPFSQVITQNITFMGVIEISIKNHQKWHQNKGISPKFHGIAKVYLIRINFRADTSICAKLREN